MIDTKLILIEGPPGSGKTTTTQKLADEIRKAGKSCRCFFEWSTDHPIPIGDDLHLGEVIDSAIAREGEMLQLWRRFVETRRAQDGVTVMESRFWQTSVMLMYIAGHPVEDLLESNRRVIEAIQILNPALIYFDIDDQKAFAARTIQIKNEEWQQAGLRGSWVEHIYKAFETKKWFTDRGMSGTPGMYAMLEGWSQVAAMLYDRAPFPKIKLRNPQEDWTLAMHNMRAFLELA